MNRYRLIDATTGKVLTEWRRTKAFQVPAWAKAYQRENPDVIVAIQRERAGFPVDDELDIDPTDMTKAQLIDYAAELGITTSSSMRKSDLLDLVLNHDA